MTRPVKIQSWKSTTMRVEMIADAVTSTTNLVGPSIIVKSMRKPMTINDTDRVDLSNINRALRGHREPIRGTMENLLERETA